MIPECIQCGQPMVLQKAVKAKDSNARCRVRRFHCDLCDYTETIYAEGTRDIDIDPSRAIVDVQNHFNQEEEARS